MRIVKFVLASSALTLALAGAASAATVYDTSFTDLDQSAVADGRNILTAQHSFISNTSPTDQFFTITIKGATDNNTFFNILVDDKPNGNTVSSISGIDYYFSSKAFVTSVTDDCGNLAATLSKTYDTTSKTTTLVWAVKADLGSKFDWYATTSNGGLNNVYDLTSDATNVAAKVSATPIPGAAWLLGSGLLGLLGLKRRKNLTA